MNDERPLWMVVALRLLILVGARKENGETSYAIDDLALVCNGPGIALITMTSLGGKDIAARDKRSALVTTMFKSRRCFYSEVHFGNWVQSGASVQHTLPLGSAAAPMMGFEHPSEPEKGCNDF